MSMVFKPESSTTPVGPVFNANQDMGPEKTSFNKKLLDGSYLLPRLQTLIIQFCYHPKIALLDISKLYSRIRVSEWMMELHKLDKITVNRCLMPQRGKVCFIASFSDSSNVGLGVNTYVISEDQDYTCKSELVFCKAKLLPLKKKYTTPRQGGQKQIFYRER